MCVCVCVGGVASLFRGPTPPTLVCLALGNYRGQKTNQQITTEQKNKRPAAVRRENGVGAKPPAFLLLLLSSHAGSHRWGARGRIVDGVGVVGRHRLDQVPPRTREAQAWRLKSMVVPVACLGDKKIGEAR